MKKQVFISFFLAFGSWFYGLFSGKESVIPSYTPPEHRFTPSNTGPSRSTKKGYHKGCFGKAKYLKSARSKR